jgi:ABC-2 type transport system permease protein
MTGAWPVFIREMMILQKRYRKMLLSMAVSPILFMIAFGWGLGRGISMEGVDYLSFLTPGLMAMASMNRSFAISSEINIARFYWHIFEEFQAAPISNFSIVLGETAAGCVRGLIGALVVYLLALFFGVKINAGPLLWIMILLNCLVFSSVAVCTAMVVKSHADQSFHFRLCRAGHRQLFQFFL